MWPSSRPASFNMDLTLASSVTSQCKAKERTPRPERSMTVRCASRAELRKVMATSAPARARARAEARPRRRAPPVMRQVLSRRGWEPRRAIFGFYSRTLLLIREGHFMPGTLTFGFYLPEGEAVTVKSRRAGVPPGRGLFAQGMPSLRIGEGEPCQALSPRRI